MITSVGSGASVATLAASMPYIVDLPENHGAKRDGVTDDTAAIQAAINSAVAKCQANGSFYCEVWFTSGIYKVAGPLVSGSPTFGNSQITLPIVTAGSTAQKVTLVLRGNNADVALPHWNQTVSQKSGTVLYTTATGTSGTVVDAVHGYTSVIGGPTTQQGFGGGTGNAWSNMLIVVAGIEIMSNVANPTMAGFNFEGLLEAVVLNSGYYVDATPTVMGGFISTPANFTNQLAFGLKMPITNNNDLCIVDDWSCEGAWYGIVLGEHTHIRDMRSVYCGWGINLDNTVGTPHCAHIDFASVEVCINIMGLLSPTGNFKLDIDLLDVENAGLIWDSNSLICGQVNIAANEIQNKAGLATGNIISSWIGNWNASPTNGSQMTLKSRDIIAGAITGAQPTVPASTVAYYNPFLHDAAVTITGGTVTVIAVDGATTGLTSGTVIVPAGRKIAITYSVAPSWNWVVLS